MMSRLLCQLVVAIAAVVPVAAHEGVLVTGATGPTGSILYRMLKDRGVQVRALVRNTTKARNILGCQKCDTSEGIFMGDITQEDALAEASKGVASLAIVTSAIPQCSAEGCGYPEGQYPIDVDWVGGVNQVKAFVTANEGRLGHVVLLSAISTTTPNGPLDQIGEGMIGFYKLNLEAFLMSSGVPFTIVKACGLDDSDGGKKQLLVGNHDTMPDEASTIARADVARVMAEALQSQLAINVRTDLCAREGPPTKDLDALLLKARKPW